MATIRAHTTIEQSNKLAEILPLESADMCFYNDGTAIKIDANSYTVRYSMWKDYVEVIPCWSFTALLDIIPKCIGDYNIFRMDINDKDFSIWYDEIGCGVNNKLPDITMKEPVDACYEMIVKLNKQKLL